jgi:hypothetical protein
MYSDGPSEGTNIKMDFRSTASPPPGGGGGEEYHFTLEGKGGRGSEFHSSFPTVNQALSSNSLVPLQERPPPLFPIPPDSTQSNWSAPWRGLPAWNKSPRKSSRKN